MKIWPYILCSVGAVVCGILGAVTSKGDLMVCGAAFSCTGILIEALEGDEDKHG